MYTRVFIRTLMRCIQVIFLSGHLFSFHFEPSSVFHARVFRGQCPRCVLDTPEQFLLAPLRFTAYTYYRILFYKYVWQARDIGTRLINTSA